MWAPMSIRGARSFRQSLEGDFQICSCIGGSPNLDVAGQCYHSPPLDSVDGLPTCKSSPGRSGSERSIQALVIENHTVVRDNGLSDAVAERHRRTNDARKDHCKRKMP